MSFTMLLFLSTTLLRLVVTSNTLPSLHFPLTRRGESFPAPDVANLSFLLSSLNLITSRFNTTVVSSSSFISTVVRKPRHLHGTQASTILLGDVGVDGSWFANLYIGTPPQQVDMDIDMLAADWWVLSTQSGKGSFFLDFNSRTYQDPEKGHPFPTCGEPKDMVHLDGEKAGRKKEVQVSFAHCRPAKQWIRTLGPSGAHLGVAPGTSLSQTKTKGLLVQLFEAGIVHQSVFSLMVVNGKDGMLSIGGVDTIETKKVGMKKKEDEAKQGHEVNGVLELLDVKEYLKGDASQGSDQQEDRIEIRHQETRRDGAPSTRNQLGRQDKNITNQEHPRDQELEKRVAIPAINSKEKGLANDWIWHQVQGPEGWWQMVMTGVWVGGKRVSQNQPIVFDINTPFILAPPLAARAFYASISGSRRLPVPYEQFFAYPCLNSPQIYLEFGEDRKVQVLKGERDKGTFSPGGRFSLGRMSLGSGYCVGIVVESRMAIRGNEREEGNGLEDVWVIGEPFFRDCQVAFDWVEKKIGIQRL